MKNNELKENVLKNVKENIAISNIVNEMKVEKRNNKVLIYRSLSTCAAVILVGVLFVNGNMHKSTENMANQQVKDELIVGKLENEKFEDKSKNNFIEKDPMMDSVNPEMDNYRGEELKQTANNAIISTDKAPAVEYTPSEESEVINIKQIIEKILEVVLPIVKE